MSSGDDIVCIQVQAWILATPSRCPVCIIHRANTYFTEIPCCKVPHGWVGLDNGRPRLLLASRAGSVCTKNRPYRIMLFWDIACIKLGKLQLQTRGLDVYFSVSCRSDASLSPFPPRLLDPEASRTQPRAPTNIFFFF